MTWEFVIITLVTVEVTANTRQHIPAFILQVWVYINTVTVVIFYLLQRSKHHKLSDSHSIKHSLHSSNEHCLFFGSVNETEQERYKDSPAVGTITALVTGDVAVYTARHGSSSENHDTFI